MAASGTFQSVSSSTCRRNPTRSDRPLQSRLLPGSDRIAAIGQIASRRVDLDQLHLNLLATWRTDVGRPDLIGSLDLHVAQKIRVNLVAWRGFGGVWLAIDRLDPHALHQRCDMAPANGDALAVQKIAQHPAASKRPLQMQFVDPPHDREILRRDRPGLVIDAAAAEAQNLGLSGDREFMIAIDHRFALSNPAFVSACSKKSFSSVNSPILAWRTFKSTLGAAVSLLSAPKTPAAPSSR